MAVNSDQVHIDLGALAQRVTGLEGSIVSIGDQLRELARKLDGKPTNWYGVIAGVVGLLTLIGGVFAQAIAPINADLGRHEREIGHIVDNAVSRVDYQRDADKNERWSGSLRDRLEDKVGQRQFAELKERLDERYRITEDYNKSSLARLEKRIDTLDLELVKRPEIEAANHAQDGRIDSVANGLHMVQEQLAGKGGK